MKLSSSGNVIRTAALMFLLVITFSVDVFAQGRGRAYGLGRKCDKFVNCHDARDGRWDNRGPDRSGNWNSAYTRRRHVRNRDIDRDDWRRSRRYQRSHIR